MPPVSTLPLVPLRIAGNDVLTQRRFQTTNPATDEAIAEVSGVFIPEAEAAVEAAQTAFRDWSRTKTEKRRNTFLKAADILEHRSPELCGYMQQETGAANAWCEFNVRRTSDLLRDIAGRIATIQGAIPETADEGRTALVYKEPLGVILAIAPWNAPYILGFRSVAYALAVGNTCVLKGSELAPRCFWAIESIFKDAGLPAGCLNVIYHRPQDAAEVTRALIEHPCIKKVNFTGSTTVGRIIAGLAGRNVKPVLMELGGKASTIVLESADLRQAALACARGSFLHAGQICMACERIIVLSSIASAFAGELKTAIDDVSGSGDGSQLMVSKDGARKTKQLVQQALQAGAVSLIGGEPPNTTTARMNPTVLQGVSKQMELYYTESFGPVASFFTVDGEQEAITIANDTEYGLSATVFTNDLQQGLRVAKQIESGAVHINSMTIHDEPRLPHGGVKNSGFGRFGGAFGLEEFLQTKTVTFQD